MTASETPQDTERLYALLPEGALRLHPKPTPTPFYSLYHDLCAGLYEAARTYRGGTMFGFEPHHQRMLGGCQAIDLHPSLSEHELRTALQQVIDEHPVERLKLRWDLCAEPYTSLGTTARMIATATPLQPLPEELRQGGVAVRTTTELVRHDPHTKGSAFAVDRQRIPYPTADNYEPLLVSQDGEILEGAQSNFGCFLDDALHVHLRHALPGITIAAILHLARAAGIPVVEAPIPVERIPDMQEAFLCSSVRNLVPIRKINDHDLPAPHPTSRVSNLIHRYETHARATATRLA